MKDKEKTTNQSTDELTKEEQILIVEDERIVSKDIKIRLQRFGYTVSGIAISGEDAVKKAEELHPDLVLMDIVLEGKMNGINAAEIIRSRFNIPIVYLTAYSDKSTLERAKKTEPFGYILKPFDDRDLSTTIEVALYKHKMENRLKESEERFRQFFENAPEYCYMISSEGKILDINSSALTALGYTKEEIVGKPLLTTTCAPSSIEKTKELFMRWKKTGKLRDEEITIITKKGEERTVLLSTDSVRDSAGKLVHSISLQRDITERKKAEEALKESEEFNFALFEHNPIQTIAIDNSGKVANFNMVKKTSGDRLPNIGDVMYKDYAGKHEINMHAELMECIKSKKLKRFPEMQYDGKFLDITLAPFPQGAIITSYEVTKRKKAEERIIHLNAVLHAIRNVNQLITKEKDRDKLLQRTCDNLTETRGYSNVWIALVDENKKLVTAAESGLGNNFLPMLKKLKRGELTDCGQKVMKRSGVYAIVDPPKSCKDCPIAKGYKGKGAFAIRLEYEGKVYGFMSISIPLDFVKNKEEQALFKEVVDDIAFALHNIEVEEALKESEERYRDLVEKAGIGILIDDREGNVKYLNKKYMEMLKYSSKEMKKLSIKSVVHPDDVEKVLKYHKNRIQGRRTPSRYEFRAIRKDRSVINLEVDAVALRVNGKITGSRSYILDITERKKAEEKLKQRTHDLNERVKELSCIYKIDEISRKEGTIEEVLKKTVLIIPPSWLHPEITGSRITFEGKEYKTNNFKKTKWMQKSDIVVNNKNAGFVEICCLEKRPDASEGRFSNEERNLINAIAERISQLANRKKAEAALYKSEEKYRTLTENVNVGVYRNTTKPEGKFIEVNLAFVKMFGYKNREEMLTIRILNIYQIPEDRKKFIEKLLRDGFVRNEELKLKKKDGSPIICSVSAVIIKDKKGKAKYYDGIIENITERRLAEEALRKSEMTYRALFESGNDPVILFSLNGTIVSANQKAAEILGYNVEELIGMSYKDIIASSEIKDADDKLKSLQEGKTFLPYECTVYKKNGTEFPSEVNLSLVQDENNKPVFLQTIFRDITERKRADEELLTSREQLRNLAAHLQAVREGERTSIAREIHDDLGQTLTALKMDLSLLGAKLPKDQKSLLKKTKSMSKLIDSTIQTVQRISAELRPGVLDDVGLTAALEWQGNEFQKRTGIKCELTVDPEDIFLDKDRSTAIFRIFQETLTNVARHSKAKWIKVNLKKKARRLELKVRDNGRGITEEQISNSKSFGLIGIRERVQFLGGKVEIRGIQNRGTTLKAWIPLLKDKK